MYLQKSDYPPHLKNDYEFTLATSGSVLRHVSAIAAKHSARYLDLPVSFICMIHLSITYSRLSDLNHAFSAFPSQKVSTSRSHKTWWGFFVCFLKKGKIKALGMNFPPPLIRRFPEIVRMSLTY